MKTRGSTLKIRGKCDRGTRLSELDPETICCKYKQVEQSSLLLPKKVVPCNTFFSHLQIITPNPEGRLQYTVAVLWFASVRNWLHCYDIMQYGVIVCVRQNYRSTVNTHQITLPKPSSKWELCMQYVRVRIGKVVCNHLSSEWAMKSQVLHTVCTCV